MSKPAKKRIAVLSVDVSKYPDSQLRTYEIDFLSPALRIKAPDMDAAIDHFSNMPQFKDKDVEIVKMRPERRVGVLAKYTDFSMDAIMTAMVQSQTLAERVEELEQELQAARELFENQSNELHMCQDKLEEALKDADRAWQTTAPSPQANGGDEPDYKALYRAEAEKRASIEKQFILLQNSINNSSHGEEFRRLRTKLEKRSEQAHRLHEHNKDLQAMIHAKDKELAELRSAMHNESLKRMEAQGELKGLQKSLETLSFSSASGSAADVGSLLEAERRRRMELEVQLRTLQHASPSDESPKTRGAKSDSVSSATDMRGSGESAGSHGSGDDDYHLHGDLSPDTSVSRMSHASFSASESSFRMEADHSGSLNSSASFAACNACSCAAFKSDPTTTWICVSCGHFSINHRSASGSGGQLLRDLRQ